MSQTIYIIIANFPIVYSRRWKILCKLIHLEDWLTFIKENWLPYEREGG